MKLLQLSTALLATATVPLFAQDDTKLEVPSVIVIDNVHVWDGMSDTIKKDHDVLIIGDKIRKVAKDIPASGEVEVDAVRKEIKEIVPDAPGFEGGRMNFLVEDEEGKVEKVSAKVTKIDGGGGYLIPGIIDSHQHIMLSKWTGPKDIFNDQLPYTPAYNAIAQGMIMLNMGVTTIRDTGGNSVELGMAIDTGIVDGPRIYSAGAGISCTSGHADFGGRAPGQGQRFPGSAAGRPLLWGRPRPDRRSTRVHYYHLNLA